MKSWWSRWSRGTRQFSMVFSKWLINPATSTPVANRGDQGSASPRPSTKFFSLGHTFNKVRSTMSFRDLSLMGVINRSKLDSRSRIEMSNCSEIRGKDQ